MLWKLCEGLYFLNKLFNKDDGKEFEIYFIIVWF